MVVQHQPSSHKTGDRRDGREIIEPSFLILIVTELLLSLRLLHLNLIIYLQTKKSDDLVLK